MKQHIILTAFGTTTLAQSTYNHLDSLIKVRFPHSATHWHFSSPAVNRKGLEDLIKKVSLDNNHRIIVQSIHVTPGHEFHQMVRAIRASDTPALIGMPLLTTPQDHKRVVEVMLPIIKNGKQDCILVLGHGTKHPSWTVLPAFEKIFREIAGNHVFVAALEKYPLSNSIIDEIVSAGFSHIMVIPLLITAGMHFKRDIIGDSPESWKNRLEKKNIMVSLHDTGLGMIDGIADIICDHIEEATNCPAK